LTRPLADLILLDASGRPTGFEHYTQRRLDMEAAPATKIAPLNSNYPFISVRNAYLLNEVKL
jgi:hypothetical protein